MFWTFQYIFDVDIMVVSYMANCFGGITTFSIMTLSIVQRIVMLNVSYALVSCVISVIYKHLMLSIIMLHVVLLSFFAPVWLLFPKDWANFF
jgi:hypothetical protein